MCWMRPPFMADVSEVVQRSMNINEKLGPRSIAAAEQNAIFRIGWTNAGDPVPKNGELGLCPALPDGARLRALGVLGSWVAAFGSGGSFTIQGDAGSFTGSGQSRNQHRLRANGWTLHRRLPNGLEPSRCSTERATILAHP